MFTLSQYVLNNFITCKNRNLTIAKKKRLSVAYGRHISQKYVETEKERMEKDIQVNGREKWVGVAILMSDYIGTNVKYMKSDEEGHHRLIKEGRDHLTSSFGCFLFLL